MIHDDRKEGAIPPFGSENPPPSARARESKELQKELTKEFKGAPHDASVLTDMALGVLQSRGQGAEGLRLKGYLEENLRRLTATGVKRMPERAALLVTNTMQRWDSARTIFDHLSVSLEDLARALDLDKVISFGALDLDDVFLQRPFIVQKEPSRYEVEVDYAVRVGADVVFHSSSQAVALDRYAEELERNPDKPVRFVAPRSSSHTPTFRGRALARSPERDR